MGTTVQQRLPRIRALLLLPAVPQEADTTEDQSTWKGPSVQYPSAGWESSALSEAEEVYSKERRGHEKKEPPPNPEKGRESLRGPESQNEISRCGEPRGRSEGQIQLTGHPVARPPPPISVPEEIEQAQGKIEQAQNQAGEERQPMAQRTAALCPMFGALQLVPRAVAEPEQGERKQEYEMARGGEDMEENGLQ